MIISCIPTKKHKVKFILAKHEYVNLENSYMY